MAASPQLPPTSPLTPFALERYFAQWEFNAPYLLCTSDIQGYALKDLLALADKETAALWETMTLGYTESRGLPLLRQEIARLYESANLDEVLCFAGAEEAIYIAMRVLLKPGDHIVVTYPGYQSLYQIAKDMGVKVSHWELRPARTDDGRMEWHADPAQLRKLVQPETRMIVVNFPHNPTGALPSQTEWQEILHIASDAGCYLFSDEVYRYLEYDPADRLPAAVDRYEKALSLGVMSKPFGLAGLRIGWLALRDHALYEQLAHYKDYTTICSSAPSEILSLIALRAKEKVLARSLGIIRANLSLVEQTMRDMADFFEWISPRAGSIAFPRWKGAEPVEQFAEALVRQAGVLILPGSVYDQPGGYFRLGLGRENIPEGLERLKEFIAASARRTKSVG